MFIDRTVIHGLVVDLRLHLGEQFIPDERWVLSFDAKLSLLSHPAHISLFKIRWNVWLGTGSPFSVPRSQEH